MASKKGLAIKGLTDDVMEKREHQRYIHAMGMQLLQMRLRDDKIREMELQRLRDRQVKVNKIIRKKVKVSDMDQGGLSVQIDQEWDTSNWSTEMIDAGCEALTLLFCSVDKVSEDKKARAVILLGKLLFRHEAAQTYVRRNMETFVGQCVNRSLRRGKSAAMLDIFYILDLCKSKFIEDISKFNYCGSFCEMLGLESRYAAILIQHTFRTFKNNRMKRPFNPDHVGFGTDMEAKMFRRSYQTSRNFELRMIWREMHWSLGAAGRQAPGGLRGPAHLPEKYVLLGLQVLLQLVHESAGECATRNREDTVRANGCIYLACMMSYGEGPYAAIATKIMTQCAKVGDSVIYAMSAGVPRACERFFKTIKKLDISRKKDFRARQSALTVTSRSLYADAESHSIHHRAASPGNLSAQARETLFKLEDDLKQSSNRLDAIKTEYIDCAMIIKGLATHAAGIFCARNGYSHKKLLRVDREDVNYFQLLRRSPYDTSAEHLRAVLGEVRVLRQLMENILNTTHMSVLHSMLRAVLALSCSDCIVTVLPELLRGGGKIMMKLVEILDEQNLVAATLSLSIFLQVCTTDAGRSALIASGVSRYLLPMAGATPHFNRLPYQRAIAVMAALCRQQDWRAYDPDNLPQDFILYSSETYIRERVIIDLMRTLKRPPLDTADNMTLQEFVLLNFNEAIAVDISKEAEDIGAQELMDFISHPGDMKYFASMAWVEAAACCQIMAALSLHRGAAENMGSSVAGHIDFIGQYLFLAQQTLRGGAVTEQKLAVILSGVAACGLVLHNMSIGCIGHSTFAWPLINTVIARNIASTVVYFIDMLGDPQSHVVVALKSLQLYAAKCILRGFDGYSSLLIAMHTPRTEDLLLELGPGGLAVCNVIKRLASSFPEDEIRDMLDKLCAILANLTHPKAGANAALNDWAVMEALRRHSPHTLSALGPLGLHDTLYINGLGRLSKSLFDLCNHLAQLEKGRNYLLADGFLRRAIEKVMLLYPYLETADELMIWKSMVKQGKELPQSSKYRQEFSACLRFIGSMSNHHHPQFGAANDVIIHESYEIAEVCLEIMKMNECPKKDECFQAAVFTIAGLCADGVMMAKKTERLDILRCITQLLVDFDEMVLSTVSQLVDIVAGICSGVRTPYVVSRIAEIREPLTRVGRLRPTLAERVRETNWVMSKMGISMRAMTNDPEKYFGVSKSLGVIGATLPTTPINRAAAVSARTPVTSVESEYLFFPSLTRAVPGETTLEDALHEADLHHHDHHNHAEHSKAYEDMMTARSQSIGDADSIDDSSSAYTLRQGPPATLSMPEGSSVPYLELEYEHSGSPGSYTMCGPSTCGSLKHIDSPGTHGSHSHISDQQSAAELRGIGMTHMGKLLLTQEPLPPSHLGKAKVRMERFLDTYHPMPKEIPSTGTTDSFDFDTAPRPGSRGHVTISHPKMEPSLTQNKALLLATTSAASARPLQSTMNSPLMAGHNSRLITSAPADFDHKHHHPGQKSGQSLKKKKSLATTATMATTSVQKKMLSVSIDEIPELMMTKPLTPMKKTT